MTRTAKPRLTRHGKHFTRDLGWKVNAQGKRVQHRFVLGQDRAIAERAVVLLDQLWAAVVQAADLDNRNLGPTDETRQPLWDTQTLWIAGALRKGEAQIVVPYQPVASIGEQAEGSPSHGAYGESAYATYLHALRTQYPFVAFVPDSPEAVRRGQDHHRHVAQDRARQARLNAAIADAPIPTGAGKSLYQGLDACAAHILATKTRNGQPTAWAQVQAKNILRLKKSHGDLAIEQIDYNVVERMKLHWERRPSGAKTGRPISLLSVEAQLKALRTFFKWLHRNPDWPWRLLPDIDDLFSIRPDHLRTDAEVASLKRVATYTLEELVILYQHATDRERVLLLLGLNAGFARAECVSLRKDELHLDEEPPTLKRVRRKSRVYGEFVLWPETVRALHWVADHQRDVEPAGYPFVLATINGSQLREIGIANQWNKLLNRVSKHQPAFRRLSFKHLRKTSAQLVRNVADGETAGVFLCHGRPVRSDDLLDAYTNRDFSRVHAALAKVHEQLRPMFATVDQAFTTSPKRSTRPRRRAAG